MGHPPLRTDVLTPVLGLLALLGAAALLLRLFRSAGRAALGAAEVAAAWGIAENSARRGDVTRMQEGKEIERKAKAVRRRAAAETMVWLLWLAVPLAFGNVREAYALAAPLWLLAGARSRPRRRSTATFGEPRS